MQRALVIDKNKKPLMPCNPARARELLRKGKAVVYKHYPFTIMVKDREEGSLQNVAFKVDPGSKETGIALVADFRRGKRAIWAAVLEHRGQLIKNSLETRRSVRRSRRNRHTRYRSARFNNRHKHKGSLQPSLQSRVENIWTWFLRLNRACPIVSIAQELVKFDMQLMQDAEISGVEYQRGTLFGAEVREYLLKKWGYRCAYCGSQNEPLEIEHVTPKSRGGSNRVSNLTLACHGCNQTKNTQTAIEFGFPEIQKQAKQPLKDAAAVNATRWEMYNRLQTIGICVEVGTGGLTKFNRTRQSYPKSHWIDAVCIGKSGEHVYLNPNQFYLHIKATGHGSRQMCGTNKFGFPIRHRTRSKFRFGFQTGDTVQAVIPIGKYAGIHTGRIIIRNRPSFKLNGFDVHPNYLTLIHRAEGYSYEIRKNAFLIRI